MRNIQRAGRIGRTAFALLAGLLALGGALAPASAADALVLRRGIGLHNWLTWPANYNEKTKTYTWPPFGKPAGELSAAELKKLRELGFDFVRLTVDPGPFIAFQGDKRTALLRQLTDVVGKITQADLSVLVDFHPRGASEYPWNGDKLLDPAGAAGKGFRDILGTVAQALSAAPSGARTALEIVNEPEQRCNDTSWSADMAALYAAARRGSPTLTLMITGSCWSGIDELALIDPRPYLTQPTLFTFHFYEPFAFTHQGFQGMPTEKLTGIPYPVDPAKKDAITQAAEAALKGADSDTAASARKYLKEYFEGATNPQDMARRMQPVVDWAEKYGVPHDRIVLGEFGANRIDPTNKGAAAPDRARYVADVRNAAENLGFGWSFWNYNNQFSSGFDLTTSNANREPELGLVCALGLAAPAGKKC